MTNKQLEIDFLNLTNNKIPKLKDELINFIERNEFTKNQLEFIYENVRTNTEKLKPLQRRLGHVYFIYKGQDPLILKTHQKLEHDSYLKTIEINEKNVRVFKIGKSNSLNIVNRVSEQIDKRYPDQIMAISPPMSYQKYSKLELDLHHQYHKNRAYGRRSEDFIGLTDDEINNIKNILGDKVSIKALQIWQVGNNE